MKRVGAFLQIAPALQPALLSAVLVSLPAAQAQDLGAYRELGHALSRAQSVRPTDVGAALIELDRAEGVFAVLRPSLRTPPLSSSIQGALDQARAALARTPTDLEAQTLYAQALLRHALYTQTLQDLLQADVDTGPRLNQLAQDFGLNAADTAALRRAGQFGQPEIAAALLQQAAARQTVAVLAPWQSGAAALSRDEAYLRLTQASGWYLHLAELTGAPDAATYSASLNQVAQGNLAGSAQSVRQLHSTALQLQQSLRDQLAAAQSSAEKPAVPQRETPGAPGGQAQATAAQATSSVIVVPAIPEHPSATAPTVGSPARTPGGSAPNITAIYATLARALAAAGSQDQAAAQSALSQAAQAVDTLPTGLQGQATTELAAHLHSLSKRSWIEPSDIAAEIMQLRELEKQAQSAPRAGTAAPQVHALTTRLWSGQIQALAFLLLTALLPLPFYFKFQALGHQKGEWALIVTGIGMLVIPAFTEGLTILFSWLGNALGIPLLEHAALLSMRHSPLGHLLWWLFTLIGILLMTAGFYQLSCRRKQVALAKARWTSARSQVTTEEAAPPEPQSDKLTRWTQPVRWPGTKPTDDT
ncbi:hypothetical protein GCM10017783_01320 [Deinococcus piscis]|uniref:Uncharacterized protein n=1 Tax=Deinococcus piscis TaxID=394230 RepID=A0ABQ3JZT2_9DEIO|nr:hypothetical protein [Deinococcus piscis]GHF93153.1 hypothetical protein GCM10017783_01320 [Deinococcus piscis]